VKWEVNQGGNGHLYEVVETGGSISWTAAKADAEARGGYLVTLTSAAEDAFVRQLINDPRYWGTDNGTYPGQWGPWIGAYQTNPSAAPDQSWAWVTGEQWQFTNWTPTEPNDCGWGGVVESYAHFSRYESGNFGWNDFTDEGHYSVHAYVFEAVPAPSAALALTVSVFIRRRRA